VITIPGLAVHHDRITQQSPRLPLLSRLHAPRNASRGLVDVHSLGDRRVTLLERTFEQMLPAAADVAERFYAGLFARFPGVKPMFSRVSMRGQEKHFMTALTMVIESLRTPDLVQDYLRQLGDRHRGYGVIAAHYPAVSAVMLETLQGALGPAWTDEVEAAWHDGLDAISRAMLSAGIERAPEMRRETAARSGNAAPPVGDGASAGEVVTAEG